METGNRTWSLDSIATRVRFFVRPATDQRWAVGQGELGAPDIQPGFGDDVVRRVLELDGLHGEVTERKDPAAPGHGSAADLKRAGEHRLPLALEVLRGEVGVAGVVVDLIDGEVIWTADEQRVCGLGDLHKLT